MIHSMTGYASASLESPRGALSIELRSVNARFLDLQFRVGEELRTLEPMLREMIAARVARGKVECRLLLNEEHKPLPGERLNPDAMARLKKLSKEASAAFPEAQPLRLADVLRWPGVIAEAPADREGTRAAAERLCRRVLDEFVTARAREGAKLAAAIGERVASMRQRVEKVMPLIPQALADYQNRLSEKLQEALGSGDDERLRVEVALFAARSDVDEELTRLRSHLDEVERTLAAGGARSEPIGKRLDFLAQELNREANTLASKAANQKISDCALELKVLIEQVREQVQNIE